MGYYKQAAIDTFEPEEDYWGIDESSYYDEDDYDYDREQEKIEVDPDFDDMDFFPLTK